VRAYVQCNLVDVLLDGLPRVSVLGAYRVIAVYLSCGPIGQKFTTSVTQACARRPGAAASVSRRRRERRTLLAGGGRRASRSHTLAASQAFERMHTLCPMGPKLRYSVVVF
jgi:hypothetical protein